MDGETKFQLTEAERALLPTAKDLEFYREHGYWISPRIYTDEELDRAIAGQERYYSGERDRELSPAIATINWQPGTPGLRKSDYASLQNRELASIVRKPILGAMAARLCGESSVRLWADQLLYKPPSKDSSGNVGWHTDRNYWTTCTSDEMLTAWVPFTDVDATMGPMMFIDGSNKWKQLDFDQEDFFNKDMDVLEQQIAQRFDTGGAKVVKVLDVLSRGQVSFHHMGTIHGSSANTSDRVRRAIAVHMQPGSNRYRQFKKKNGEPTYHINDYLVRPGADGPDYADPDFCPVLWEG